MLGRLRGRLTGSGEATLVARRTGKECFKGRFLLTNLGETGGRAKPGQTAHLFTIELI